MLLSRELTLAKKLISLLQMKKGKRENLFFNVLLAEAHTKSLLLQLWVLLYREQS
jgi:hypothetical protein